MSLYLLRHGETEFNAAGRYQGQNNSDLTAKGIRQARNNGALLASLIDRNQSVNVVSSPLKRTMDTTRYVLSTMGRADETVTTDNRLMEMHYGSWQGLTEFEINSEFPGEWEKRLADPAGYEIPGGGESYTGLFARIDNWLADTRDFWENGGIWIVISHGGTGSVIRGRYLGLDIRQIRALPRPHDQIYKFNDGDISPFTWTEDQ